MPASLRDRIHLPIKVQLAIVASWPRVMYLQFTGMEIDPKDFRVPNERESAIRWWEGEENSG